MLPKTPNSAIAVGESKRERPDNRNACQCYHGFTQPPCFLAHSYGQRVQLCQRVKHSCAQLLCLARPPVLTRQSNSVCRAPAKRCAAEHAMHQNDLRVAAATGQRKPWVAFARQKFTRIGVLCRFSRC